MSQLWSHELICWLDAPAHAFWSSTVGEKQFYQLYFQEPGNAEAEFEADVRKSILMVLYSASGDIPPDKRWRFMFDKSETFLDCCLFIEFLASR